MIHCLMTNTKGTIYNLFQCSLVKLLPLEINKLNENVVNRFEIVKQKQITMRKLTLLMLAITFMFASQVKSQSVQIIHNSGDIAADTVDVIVNGNKAVSDLAYREATQFLSLPSGSQIDVGIQPTEANSPVKTFQIGPLSSNTKYVAVVDGIVQTSLYNPDSTLSLEIKANAKTSSNTPGDVEVLLHHGVTDAPDVDIINPTLGTISNDLSYESFDGYVTAPAANATINVETANNAAKVASFTAPLNNFGGDAITVVASGFLAPSDNNLGPAFGLYVADKNGGPMVKLPREKTEAQVIHNSPDQASDTVDVFVNGERAIQDFAFRESTAFVPVPSGIVDIGIAENGTETVVKSFQPNFMADTPNVGVVNGVVFPNNYEDSKPLSFDLKTMARTSAETSGNADILVHHGSLDAPAVDIEEQDTLKQDIVTNLSYSNFTDYLSNEALDYTLAVKASSNGNTVAAFDAPVSNLKDLAFTVVASGFLDTSGNNGGPGFGLFAAGPGGGPMIELPQDSAELQVIHNSPDAAADTVDVYVNGDKLLDDFQFRDASPFVSMPAGTKQIGIAPYNSTDLVDSFNVTLSADQTYIAVASGVIRSGEYDDSEPFDLDIKTMARKEANSSGKTDILAYHGSPDAGNVDIDETDVLDVTLFDDLGYGNFSDYQVAETDNYVLAVKEANSDNTVQKYEAPLADEGLEDEAITVFASGFVDPSGNSDGPEFGLYVATQSGGITKLPEKSSSGITNATQKTFDIFPNPASNKVRIQLDDLKAEDVSIELIDQKGQVLKRKQVGSGNDTNLDLSNYENGAYFLRIENEGKQIATERFIKN